MLLLTTTWIDASKRQAKKDSLASYIARVQTDNRPARTIAREYLGGLGTMANLSVDYKAMAVGDRLKSSWCRD